MELEEAISYWKHPWNTNVTLGETCNESLNVIIAAARRCAEAERRADNYRINCAEYRKRAEKAEEINRKWEKAWRNLQVRCEVEPLIPSGIVGRDWMPRFQPSGKPHPKPANPWPCEFGGAW